MTQANEALYDRGHQEFIPHTPGSAVAAGQIVLLGAGTQPLVGVAPVAIAANTPGDLDVSDLSMYRVRKKAAVTFEVGDRVGWDEGNNEALEADDVAAEADIGACLIAAGASDEFVYTGINRARPVVEGS